MIFLSTLINDDNYNPNLLEYKLPIDKFTFCTTCGKANCYLLLMNL